MRKLTLCLLVSAWLFCCGTSAAEGMHRALLIGCDRFCTMHETTPAAANNVTLMAKALSGGAMNLAALTTRKQGVPNALTLYMLMQDTFRGADAGDVSYIYVSSHGLYDAETGFQLVLSDGRTETTIDTQTLKGMLDSIPGKKVLIVDACNSGALIGKGLQTPEANLFAGEDYTIFTSSGGAEDSFLWMRPDGSLDGQSYYSGMLAGGISAENGFGADENRDGCITARELQRYLLDRYGESTPQVYPEDSETIVMRYSVESFDDKRIRAAMDAVCFERGVLSRLQPYVNLSFTLQRPAQVAYRIIPMCSGVWDFADAEWMMDTAEDEDGWLSPGWKERSLSLQEETTDSGYALLQMVLLEDGHTQVAASHVVCVPPEEDVPLALSVQSPEAVDITAGEECSFTVLHSEPCTLTVTIVDAEGNTLRRLVSRMPTRPQLAEGSPFCWSGLTADNEKAALGTVYIRVQAVIGRVTYEALSDAILLR